MINHLAVEEVSKMKKKPGKIKTPVDNIELEQLLIIYSLNYTSLRIASVYYFVVLKQLARHPTKYHLTVRK